MFPAKNIVIRAREFLDPSVEKYEAVILKNFHCLERSSLPSDNMTKQTGCVTKQTGCVAQEANSLWRVSLVSRERNNESV